ncbi:hypothetical protein GEV33_010749 [Tenebrio molitor]|uniref:DUF5641 domain-containing protein n=1 Tax=Tenebrio molitor TaxID=7067 RepID=A0A8J6HDF7_TENMO|nr:hypothetical protein GEV33_010749 [Tenebrio molitor]
MLSHPVQCKNRVWRRRGSEEVEAGRRVQEVQIQTPRSGFTDPRRKVRGDQNAGVRCQIPRPDFVVHRGPEEVTEERPDLQRRRPPRDDQGQGDRIVSGNRGLGRRPPSGRLCRKSREANYVRDAWRSGSAIIPESALPMPWSMVHIVRRCQVSGAVEEPKEFTVLPLSRDPSHLEREKISSIQLPYRTVRSTGKSSFKITVEQPLAAESTSKQEASVVTITRESADDVVSTIQAEGNTVERKLNNSQRELRQPYSNFMKEYLELGHMELVPSGEIDKRNSCYLPHHAVIKDSSTTTKLRVVFDGSSKTSNGLSLNDNLLPGPNLQQDLFLTLARFRCFQYVISSDIEKMYRQINIDERDADFQRILWRESVDSPLEIYRLKTVTYGTTSAPFLAMRCIQQFANENINNFPLACATIRQCFYMDDLLCGHNTFQETLVLRDQIIEILKQGQFNLRKWASNDPFLLPTVNSETSDNTAINLDKDGNIKTLGLTWNSKEDTLKFVIANSPAPGKITKRSILSTIAKIFDPLGLKAPFLVNAKLLLQKLWQLQLQWDQSVPNPLAEEWHRFLNELCHLSNLNILRKVIPQVPVTLLEIHGFADASMSAYGAAIYLRSRNSQGEYSTQLLCAKSRVAPLKTVSLPRLELCAALLLARLIHKTASALNPKITKQYLWTDTSIVLAWLAASPNSWQVFVANRVSEIQDLTSVNDWYHISTKDNPADVITRGMYPETLIKSETWWHGPRFLSKDLSEWPVLIPAPIPEDTGAENELQNMKRFLESSEFEVNVLEALKRQNISWHFIPPSSPHMGGIWESGVKLVKSHLRKILGVSLVTYEEMYTLLTNIEACLNSRLITPMSNDPLDFEVLTPGHFLIGKSLTAPVETNLRPVPDNRLSRWQRIEQLRQHFWARWTREYISTLQKRSKWRTQPSNTISEGTMFLIADDNLPPLLWKLGRILETHPGPDNRVRVVTIRTPQGICKRPTAKNPSRRKRTRTSAEKSAHRGGESYKSGEPETKRKFTAIRGVGRRDDVVEFTRAVGDDSSKYHRPNRQADQGLHYERFQTEPFADQDLVESCQSRSSPDSPEGAGPTHQQVRSSGDISFSSRPWPNNHGHN